MGVGLPTPLCADETKTSESPQTEALPLFPLTPRPSAAHASKAHHQGRQGGEMEELFFLPILFSISAARDPKWSLEMAVAGCPEKSCPHSLVQSSSFFLLSPFQGEGEGPTSHCVSSPLRCQSHDRVLPPSLLLHQALTAGILLQFSQALG